MTGILVWQTSKGWFVTHRWGSEHKIGPFESEAKAKEASWVILAWHGFKLMCT